MPWGGVVTPQATSHGQAPDGLAHGKKSRAGVEA